MLTALLLATAPALAAAPDRREDASDRREDHADTREDARDRAEDRADARRYTGRADAREDVRDRHEDARDRHEDVHDRREDVYDRSHRGAPHHVPAYGHRPPAGHTVVYHRPPPRGHVVVVRRGPPAPPPPATRAPARRKDPTHDVSLTMDALSLTGGLAEAGLEVELGHKTGLALGAGLGAREGEGLYTVGGDVRSYFVGNFDRGLFLGLGADVGNAHDFLPASAGVSAGPSLGAKYTFEVPLTLTASVGVDGVWTRDYHGVSPTASLGLGFSF